MTDETIRSFLSQIAEKLKPGSHCMLWVDKYIVCSGLAALLENTPLQIVDMITWNKGRMGMGYRTRRSCEYLVILQKLPVRAKGIWRDHALPDVWTEKIGKRNHAHAKPVALQARLIEAVTEIADAVIDPAAGGYSVLESALQTGRNFLGCDLLG